MFDNLGGNSNSLNAANVTDFKLLYDCTMPVLFKVSFRIVGGAEAAEDLVHDSFIKLTERGIIFPSVDDAKFWLLRVVKNASLNYVRRRNRERTVYEKTLYEDFRKVDSGEVEFLRKDMCRRTQEALQKLPPKLKVPLILREYGELKYKEISHVLGITEGNVKIRVFRAREQLAKLIGEDDVYLS